VWARVPGWRRAPHADVPVVNPVLHLERDYAGFPAPVNLEPA